MKRHFAKSEFSKNVVTLMTGTIIAQAIPIAIAPILTRIYSPDDFGLFALYMGFAAILSTIVTARYEQAIMLPKTDVDAAVLFKLSLIIAAIICISLAILIYFTNQYIANLLNKPQIANWLYLLPITTFITGLYQTLNSWNNRKKNYTNLAKNRIIQGTSISFFQIIGSIFSSNGIILILGDFFGKLITSITLGISTYKIDHIYFNVKNSEKIKDLAKRYIKFPLYDVGASLTNVSSYQIQSILFPVYFSLSEAGFYFLVLKILQAPLSIIGTSITDVYKQKLTDPKTTDSEYPIYFKKMFLLLFSIGILPFILFIVYGKNLFIVIFGEEWKQAGNFAIILAPMFFIRFIASPLSYFLYIKEKQEINIIGNFLLFVSALFASSMTNSATEAITYISISFSIIYLTYIVYTSKLAKVI